MPGSDSTDGQVVEKTFHKRNRQRLTVSISIQIASFSSKTIDRHGWFSGAGKRIDGILSKVTA